MDEKFNEMPVIIIHFDEDGTAEEVPIFNPLTSVSEMGA